MRLTYVFLVYLFFSAVSAKGSNSLIDLDSVKTIWITNRIPAITSNNPSFFAAGHLGYVGMGLSVQHRSRLELENKWKPDANSAVYLGLGNPDKWVGVAVNFNLYGTSNAFGEEDNFGEGTIDFQLARAINDFVYVGVGGYNIIQHNAKFTNGLRSYFGSVSALIPLKETNEKSFGFLFLTVGAGNGIFQKQKRILAGENNSVNFFGSAALQVLPEAHLIVEWSGVDLTISGSIFPFKKIPLHLLVGVADINFDKQRYIASIGYSFKFFKKKKKKEPSFPVLPVQRSI